MGTLNEDLTAIKAVEDKLTANQVAKFAYTQHAYDNPLTEADGVTTFNPENPQNIPLGRADILKVNPSVLQYGWRAQASAITRMLMNHFLGRVSYNLNKLNDNMSSLLTTVLSHLGTANGIATLDADGRIPYSQLPESAMELKGYWNAETNTPTLADGTGTSGDFYFVEVAGTRDLGSGEQYFAVGDRVLYDGSIWKNIASGNIKTINNRAPTATGNIDLTKTDVGLANVDNTADSNMPVANGTTKFTTGGAHNMLTSLAPAFDSSVSYSQGTIVSYQGRLYRCIEDHTGAWSDNDFAVANLNEGVGTSNVTGVKGEAESSYRSGNVNITLNDLMKGFKSVLSVSLLRFLGEKWKYINEGAYLDISYYNGLWFKSTPETEKTYYSEDAMHWTEITSEEVETDLKVFMYAQALFLAIGGQDFYWSENGKDWHKGETIGEKAIYNYYPYDFSQLSVYNDVLELFEVCTSNGIYYSEDGKTWQQGSFIGATVPVDFRLNCIATSDSIIVAGESVSNRIWWSEDGKVWTSATVSANGYSVNEIYYGNDEFMCIAGGREVYSSANGKVWTRILAQTGVTYSNAKVVFVPDVNIWIAVTVGTNTNGQWVYMSQHIKGFGWGAISQTDTQIPSSGESSGVNSIITCDSSSARSIKISDVFDIRVINSTTVLLATNVGVVSLKLTNFEQFGANVILDLSSNLRGRVSAVSVDGAYFPCFALVTQNWLLQYTYQKNYVIFSYKDLIILYKKWNTGVDKNKILISHDNGVNWKEITLDDIETVHRMYYGGGTVLAITRKNDLPVYSVSNIETAIESIRKDFALN